MNRYVACAVIVVVGILPTFVWGASVVRSGSLGLSPDPSVVITGEIQRCIDIAAEKGDTLVLEAGDYVAGTLRLPDNTHILLEKGVRILGSVNPYDYDGYGTPESRKVAGLITADGVNNISLSGEGMIDGRGLEVALAIDSLHHTGKRIDLDYNTRRMRPSIRPKLLDINNVTGLLIEAISLRSSASWGVSLCKCTDVTISGINFENRAYWNNDGIDVSDCRNVLIENCDINSADDGIVLKSFDPEGGNDGVTVRNCSIRSSASALKFGTESFGGFRNVRVENLKIRDTFRSAVALETVDGAVLENVVVDGVEAVNTGNAIFMRLGHRHGAAPGRFRNVTVRNLKCEIPFDRPDSDYDLRGPDISVIHNPFPSSITGIPDAHIENVTLENIDISYPGRGTKGMGYIGRYRYSSVPEAVSDYPEFHMFGELPAWGFYIRHVDGITLKNVNISLRAPDYREPVVTDDVTGLYILE